ncbi:MAG: cytidylate kinase-like family protein [Eubacteriales bacterium]|nr:cytidylate kinase-like family protein [Eubacteriales bacterium]
MSKIITLSREYGAGGHSIGQKVAEELGIPLYDKDIMRATMKATGYEKELIEKEQEERSVGDNILRTISAYSSSYFNDTQDAIFEIQKTIITQFAKEGPCVILGRCADVILAEAGFETLDVFVYADTVHRAMRLSQSDLLNTKDATKIQKMITKKDNSRHVYYHHYTGKKWGDSHNYDLMLDSGKLGYDLCVKLITMAARETVE